MDFDDDIIDNDSYENLAATPEGKLLVSILNQAIEDATYEPKRSKKSLTEGSSRSIVSKNKLANKDKIDAIQWLFDDNDVYDLCCEVAGIHKDKVRELVIEKVGAKIIYPLVYGHYQPNGH